MEWNELYDQSNQPTLDDITKFVDNDLWQEVNTFLQTTYNVSPRYEYSRCSMDKGFWKGWNAKYKKSGKSLCTIYPKQGYFVALVPVGAKEIAEADLLIPLCDEYTQKLYSRTEIGYNGKSLAVEVTSANILRDLKNLIALRVAVR